MKKQISEVQTRDLPQAEKAVYLFGDNQRLSGLEGRRLGTLATLALHHVCAGAGADRLPAVALAGVRGAGLLKRCIPIASSTRDTTSRRRDDRLWSRARLRCGVRAVPCETAGGVSSASAARSTSMCISTCCGLTACCRPAGKRCRQGRWILAARWGRRPTKAQSSNACAAASRARRFRRSGYRSRRKAGCVTRSRRRGRTAPRTSSLSPSSSSPNSRRWCRRRVFGIDVSTSVHCGGAVRIVASIEEPTVIRAILAHFEKHDALSQAHYCPRPRGPPAVAA